MIVKRSALLALPAAHMFDVIEAAEHYPAFLPWCVGAHILSRDDETVSADMQVRLAGMNFEMRTRNPKRRPTYMAIHLERGPFRRFEGEWALTVLAPEACKVAFTLDYEFDSTFMTHAAGPVFKRIADSMVDAFVQRARAVPYAAAVPVPVPVPVPMPMPVAVAGPAPGPASQATPAVPGAALHQADLPPSDVVDAGPVMPNDDTLCAPPGTTPS